MRERERVEEEWSCGGVGRGGRGEGREERRERDGGWREKEGEGWGVVGGGRRMEGGGGVEGGRNELYVCVFFRVQNALFFFCCKKDVWGIVLPLLVGVLWLGLRESVDSRGGRVRVCV